jgi:hypothetical protein
MAPPPNFAIFILTHGRPERVVTYKTLRTSGYTGPIYLVIDNEDAQASRYYEAFGEQVLMFDKLAMAETFDTGDNFTDRRAVVYARNACFGLAQSLGFEYFLELDDDYHEVRYRFDDHGHFVGYKLVRDLDQVLWLFLEFYQAIPAIAVCFMQTGDFIGGGLASNAEALQTSRKAMNTFLCATTRPFQFVGRINEDVNTYTWYQSLGHLFLSINQIVINQHDTQQYAGGMTDLYRASGTYVKSFYTVMYQPSSVSIGAMGMFYDRLHHQVRWECTVPCLLAEVHRKPLAGA